MPRRRLGSSISIRGTQRSYHYWHAFVPGITAGQLYGYRVDGPCDPDQRTALRPRQGAARSLWQMRGAAGGLEPRGGARARRQLRLGTEERRRGPGCATIGRATVRRARPLPGQCSTRCTWAPSRGIPTPASRRRRRGTYPALIDKIPYLQDLGITAVELLPVFAFDDQDAPGGVNDWGYQPVSFFAPHPAYSSRPEPLGALDEFRDMVKALHRAGIEVILDVVYNHTTEGGADGPTLCFRGFANDTYYILGDTGPLRRLQRLRQHAERQPVDRAPADSRQPPLLGHRDARRRLPLRSRLDPVAATNAASRWPRRHCCGTSSRIRCSPTSS